MVEVLLRVKFHLSTLLGLLERFLNQFVIFQVLVCGGGDSAAMSKRLIVE